MDDDKADWLHEVKRDKRLDRIAELEAENSLLTDALANYEQDNARLRETLNQLANPCGRFSHDPLERAHNCIEDMIAVARAALGSKP